jgi:flagellar hook-length control protein FliK
VLNTKIVMDLDKKLNNIKTSSKKEVSKNDTEVKTDFKDYLSKEVKSDTSRDSINSKYVQKDDKAFISNEEISQSQSEIEDIISEVSNKLEELIDNEYFLGNESDIDALSEILILLSSFLNKNLGNEDLSNEVLNDSYNNFSSLNDSDLNNIQNLFLTLFNSKDDTKTENHLSNLELLRTNSSDDMDIKGLLKDVKKLTDNILEDINLNLSDTNTIDDYKNELSNKIISLLEALPNESIKSIYSNIKDENKLKILSTLSLQKVLNEDNNIEESTSNTKGAINDDFVDNKVNSLYKDVTKEGNLNDNNSLKQNSLDDNNDEDKILSKIIDSDNKGSFSKVLNYYDKFNKNNIEVIKEPMVVNKQTLDLDIIKNVKFMMKNAVQELKVKIYPKELGEMTIKILSEEGIMRAEIKATSKETYNLLNSNLHEIKKNLVDQNIKIQEVNIGIYNEDTTFFSEKENSSDNFRNQQSNENSNNSIFIDDEEIKEDLLNESNVNLLA